MTRPRRIVDGLLVAIALVVILIAWTAVDVDALEPGDRCVACKIGPAPTPRPSPVVVGVGVSSPFGTPAPAVTLPPTDAELRP